MTYDSILTSKGTTTIPVDIRRQLGLKPGMKVKFEQDPKTGEFVVRKSLTLEEVQQQIQAYMKIHNIKPLSDKQLKDAAAEGWVQGYFNS